jgi:ubiquinone/menaquinone biosynthesis C-methylase UbiE
MVDLKSSAQPLVYPWEQMLALLSADVQGPKALSYLSSVEVKQGINLTRLWKILDQGWDETEVLANEDFSQFLHSYYQHPVWLINAAFSESDPDTISDRMAAVRLIDHVKPQKVLDFGGGIGTVARLCSLLLREVQYVDLVDISDFRDTVQKHLQPFTNIRVLEHPEPPYDAIISTEVLEHLPDPIQAVVDMNKLLRVGGSFAASWSFAPCIKCHLPHNFHLNRLMHWIIRVLGFGFYGFERRGSPVYGYIKQADVTPAMVQQARRLEQLSRLPLPTDRVLLLLRGM